jgi:uncharacterized protein
MEVTQNFKKIGIVVGILLSLFLLVLTIKEAKSIGYVGRNAQALNTINVTGKGEVVAVPDIATFSFGVQENAKTVADAQKAATDKINAALKVVKDNGVAEKDITTQGYNIYPRYNEPVCTPYSCAPVTTRTIIGYEVSQMIEVKVRDISKAGTILSAIGGTGVNNISGLSFSVDKVEDLKAQAREKAINEAREKANVLARQLGVNIVGVINFNENGDMPMYFRASAYDAKMEQARNTAAVAPQIPTGEQKIVSNVTITYEIR